MIEEVGFWVTVGTIFPYLWLLLIQPLVEFTMDSGAINQARRCYQYCHYHGRFVSVLSWGVGALLFLVVASALIVVTGFIAVLGVIAVYLFLSLISIYLEVPISVPMFIMALHLGMLLGQEVIKRKMKTGAINQASKFYHYCRYYCRAVSVLNWIIGTLFVLFVLLFFSTDEDESNHGKMFVFLAIVVFTLAHFLAGYLSQKNLIKKIEVNYLETVGNIAIASILFIYYFII